MLKPWHKEDIWAALRARGWSPPVASTPRDYGVGEAYDVSRSGERLTLLFVADEGYTGDKTLEQVIVAGRADEALWLHRRRDAKWRAELHAWAEALSGSGSRGA